VFNPKYAAYAEHYGFRIVPCNVGKGNEKGRVENGVGYVKKKSKRTFCPAPPPLSRYRQLSCRIPHARDKMLGAKAPGLLQTPFSRRSGLKLSSDR
jgi:hypothetical protein